MDNLHRNNIRLLVLKSKSYIEVWDTVLKAILKYLSISILVSLIISIPFIYSVISSSEIDSALKFFPKSDSSAKVDFEAGGLVKKVDFDYFREFSEDKRFNKYIYQNLSEESNGVYEVNKNFDLRVLRLNDCKRSRCLQYKVPFSKIPLILTKGLIGIEDYRFLEHHGVDPVSIVRAIYHDLKARKLVQGGSTLTQQLAKNLFYSNEKSFLRKVKEAITAIYLELNFEKSDILQTYFNEVFWGSLNGIRIKGVQSASIIYFGKDVEALKPYEVSILVSMLKGPGYYHPIRRQSRLRKRAEFIYDRLRDLKLYSGARDRWSDEDWSKWKKRLVHLQENPYLEAIYLTSNSDKGTSEYRSYKLILSSKQLLKSKSKVSKNLSVKSVFGSKNKWNTYYSRFERDKKKAIFEERHQIGSTIKPLIYRITMDHGLELDELISPAPITLNLLSGKWTPRESHKVEEEKISFERALRESLNIPIIKAVKEIGYDKVEADLKKIIPSLKIPLSEYPSQLLGAIELSVAGLFQVYGDFLSKECSGKGDILRVLSNPNRTTIKRAVNKQLSKQEFFGKTGTTNNGYDNWFVGHDGHDLFVIWTGYEGVRKGLKKLPLYGSNTSFQIFQDVILHSGKRIGSRNCQF